MAKTITLSAIVFNNNIVPGFNEDYTTRTLKALIHSSNIFKVDKIQLITCKDIKRNDIEIIKIQEFPKNRYTCLYYYSFFILKKYHKYINTDYVLYIQHDGFIIHPELWTNEFLNYDYIGAPWEDGIVGNGGFNLSSKKMLETTAICPYNNYILEDRYKCDYHRDFFNNKGIKYAPVELAGVFSQENKTPFNKNYDINNYQNLKSFGFHGCFHKSAINLLNLIEI